MSKSKKEEWIFMDTKQPTDENTYFILHYDDFSGTPSILNVGTAYWENGIGFRGTDPENVIAWMEIDPPALPPVEELKNHGLFERIMRGISTDDGYISDF